jgi:sulfatase maturation enzyme AslB (radical SAM superfamily)
VGVRRSVTIPLLHRLLYLDFEPRQAEHVHTPELATVYWVCTQKCNLRCTYCYQDATVARKGELSTAEAFDVVGQTVEAGARTFVFTGGEPFSRPDLLEIARYSKSRGLQTNVITNGHYITTRTVEEVARTFDRITLSLDSGIAEHHDRARGRGSWKKAAGAIDLLLEAGATVGVNSVITRPSLSDVSERCAPVCFLLWRRATLWRQETREAVGVFRAAGEAKKWSPNLFAASVLFITALALLADAKLSRQA